MTEQRFAILIASSLYPKDPKLLEPLRCPGNDVDGLNEILSSENYGAFVRSIVLKDKPHYEILKQLNLTLTQASKDDLVLIYYSGHGKLNRSGRLHLATVDTEVNLLETTSIPVERILDLIDMSRSKKIVLILDCCYSGRVRDAFLKSGVDDLLKQVQIDQGIYILTASTGIQVAREKEGDEYSHFTKYIIEGIKDGKADTDNDGFVTITDLFRYSEKQMREEAAQVPMRWDLNVQGSELLVARTGDSWKERHSELIRQKLIGLERDRWPNALNTYRESFRGWVISTEQERLIDEVTSRLTREKISFLDRESHAAIEREDWSAAINTLQTWLTLEPAPEPRERLVMAKRGLDSAMENRLVGAETISFERRIVSRIESLFKTGYGKYILLSGMLLGFTVLIAVFVLKPLIGCFLVYGIFGAVLGFAKPNDPWRLGLALSLPFLFVFGISLGIGRFFRGYSLVLIAQDMPLVLAGLLTAYCAAHMGAWLSSLRRLGREGTR